MHRTMRRAGSRNIVLVGSIAAGVVAMPTSARAEDAKPAWDDSPDWGVEAQVGPTSGIRRDFGMAPRADAELGAVASIGFTRRLPYEPHRRGGHSEKGGEEVADVFIGVFTLGMAWIPPSVWYGTELGASAEFQYRAGFGSQRDRWIAAVRPKFRVSPRDSRFRFPAIVSIITPALGVAVDTPRGSADPAERPGVDTSFYLGPQLFPFSVLVDRHVAIEVEPTFPVVIRFSDGKAAMSPAFNATVVFR
jgi:hypothetical protein